MGEGLVTFKSLITLIRLVFKKSVAFVQLISITRDIFSVALYKFVLPQIKNQSELGIKCQGKLTGGENTPGKNIIVQNLNHLQKF